MARLFTRRETELSDRQLHWATRKGKIIRVTQGVYFEGDRPPKPIEVRLAEAMRGGKPVTGNLAAALHGFDGFNLPQDGEYKNVPRTNPLDTLLAISATTNDLIWEQALEWALRKQHTSIEELEAALATQRHGNTRIRRVLNLRPNGAPPTGSILETFAIQLIRRDPHLPTPTRQVQIRHWYVDLAWPERGVFLELDGEWHKDQPHYDAARQTAVIAATRWLVGRYNWSQITKLPNSTLRSISELLNP